MKARKKSFREIARELGVSPSTVSRIASGEGSYSESTTGKVMALLKNEGYAAGFTNVPVSGTVAAIVTDLSNEVYCAILTALGRYLKRKDYLLEIHAEGEDQTDLLHRLEAKGIDGIVLIGSPKVPLSLECTVPAVQVLSVNSVLYRGRAYSVKSDEYVGGRLAARELLDHGCKAPVILNTRHTGRTDSLRIRGFLDEWRKEGLSPEEVYIHDGEPNKSSFNSARDITSYLYVRGQSFDCVFACSDWRAYGALVALGSLNVPVPGQVKLIGFDGARVSRYCELPFTTVQQNPDMIASFALNLLEPLMEGAFPAENMLTVPVQLQRGMTV